MQSLITQFTLMNSADKVIISMSAFFW